MSEIIKIRKGLDIRLKGEAEKIFIKAAASEKYAVKPTDFEGLTPKILVKPEDSIKAGTALFFDKYKPEIRFTSPVSGKILEIKRGERRKILEVIIQSDERIEYEEYQKGDPLELSRAQVIERLLQSGIWPSIRQRPYGIIANPMDEPTSIFISAFDTNPLAPDLDFIMTGQQEEFQTGINALTKITKGKIHVNVDAEYPASSIYNKVSKAKVTKFRGPHPAGNVGVQIHAISPLNKGEIIWYINPQDVIIIGRLFKNGIYDASKIIALTGSEVYKPRYYKLVSGSSISTIIKDNVKDGNLRYISGNVLTGTKITSQGYIGFYDSQVTVIPEGDYYEFFGWATPGFNKYSFSRTFWSWLIPGKQYALDTNLHGGERAFVMTGKYEKVLPMDILPLQLLKAIIAEDIDQMEKLGIYEVIEEDMALCEFICTSKTEIQQLIRKGINLMIKELG